MARRQPTSQSLPIEAAWDRLRQHVEWAPGRWFGFVFVDRADDGSDLAGRLVGQGTPGWFRRYPPGDPQALAMLLPKVMADPGDLAWIEAAARDAPGSTAWGGAWGRFLTLVNERREEVRAAVGRGMVFCMNRAFKEQARSMAPDLWSARLFALDVPAPDQPPRTLPQGVQTFLPVPAPDPEVALGEARRLKKERPDAPEARAAALLRAVDGLLARGKARAAVDRAREALTLIQAGSVLQEQATLALARAEEADGDVGSARMHLRDLAVGRGLVAAHAAVLLADLEEKRGARNEALAVVEAALERLTSDAEAISAAALLQRAWSLDPSPARLERWEAGLASTHPALAPLGQQVLASAKAVDAGTAGDADQFLALSLHALKRFEDLPRALRPASAQRSTARLAVRQAALAEQLGDPASAREFATAAIRLARRLPAADRASIVPTALVGLARVEGGTTAGRDLLLQALDAARVVRAHNAKSPERFLAGAETAWRLAGWEGETNEVGTWYLTIARGFLRRAGAAGAPVEQLQAQSASIDAVAAGYALLRGGVSARRAVGRLLRTFATVSTGARARDAVAPFMTAIVASPDPIAAGVAFAKVLEAFERPPASLARRRTALRARLALLRFGGRLPGRVTRARERLDCARRLVELDALDPESRRELEDATAELAAAEAQSAPLT